jgi:hypothetical protein
VADDAGLAQRIRETLAERRGVTEKRVFVDAPGLAAEAELASWVDAAGRFVETLPAKTAH